MIPPLPQPGHPWLSVDFATGVYRFGFVMLAISLLSIGYLNV